MKLLLILGVVLASFPLPQMESLELSDSNTVTVTEHVHTCALKSCTCKLPVHVPDGCMQHICV